MAEQSFTVFPQSHSHQQLLLLRSSGIPFFHHSAQFDLQRLRFFAKPLSLISSHSFRLQYGRFPSSKICCNVFDARGSDSGNRLDLEQGDAVSWAAASSQESLSAEKRGLGMPKRRKSSPKTFGSEENQTEKHDTMRFSPANAGGVADSASRSRRGRTRKSIGLPDKETEQPSGINPSNPIGETELKSQFIPSEERDSDACSPSTKAKPFHNSRTSNRARSSDRIEEWKSIVRENEDLRKSEREKQKNESFSNTSTAKDESYKEFKARVQELITADLDKKFNEDSDDEDCPLWVDEDDPNWLDEPDDGWGFRVSEFFDEKLKKVKKKAGDDNGDADGLDWDMEPEKWSAKEIDFTDWGATVFADPSPLVVLLFERYGKKARENYHVLRELEAAANRIWDSHRLPPRLVKINASMEVDLASALRAKEFPMLLFIKAGKLLHRQTGYHTADDLMRIIAYFYHGAGRPSCLKRVEVPESVPNAL